MYVLASDEMSRADGAAMGVGGGTLVPPGAIWVTGPWGSLAHLPWAVGLADHLARTRGRAGLVEREPDGPLRTLARAGRRIPIRHPLAEAVLAGPADAVNTDLEGVSILLRRGGEAPVGGGTTDAAAGDFPLVLADGLPEALEGPYPGADCVAGVILVASFRDHSRFELDAVVRRLRETGHRLLGLTAIGPDVSEAEEAAALRTEEETEPTVQEAARAKQEAQRARVDAAAAKVKATQPMETRPATASAPVLSPLSAPASPPFRPPALEPGSKPVFGSLLGPESEGSLEPPPEAGLEPPPEATLGLPPSATLEVGSGSGLGGPSARGDDRATISLLTTWDRLAIRRSRRRHRVGGGVTVLLMIATAVAFYGVVLRPRLRPPSWPAMFRGKHTPLPVEGVQTRGVVASAAADSSVPAAESTGATASSMGTAAEVGRVTPVSGWTPGDESGDTLRRPGPGSAPGSTAGPKVGFPGVLGASPGTGQDSGVSDTMVTPVTPPDGRPGEPFVIHLTSFKLRAEAEIEVSALRLRGIEARSIQAEIPDRGTWYRIVTGNFATFAEAESVALRLQAEGKIPYAHIAADGGRGQPVPVGTLDRARP
jgi:cell division septation protein DedD